MWAGTNMFTQLQSWLRRFKPSADGAADQPQPADKSSKGDSSSDEESSVDGFRETIEQIVIAFILAFVFRTFAAEPFVIPTGSMAPTLFGRHKEYDCAGCGYHNVIGASDEVNEETSLLEADKRSKTRSA